MPDHTEALARIDAALAEPRTADRHEMIGVDVALRDALRVARAEIVRQSKEIERLAALRDRLRSATRIFKQQRDKAAASIPEPPTDDEREAHLMQDRIDFYVDHEAEPGISGNAFLRGWDAAVRSNRRRGPITDEMVEASTKAWWVTGGTFREAMRAALEAAEAVR